MSRNFFGFPGRVPPRLYGRNAEPAIVIPEGSPSNENQEGKVWGWNPNTQRMELRHPKILFGPGALDASTGNISLTNNAWVALYSGIPGDGIGFRAGLVGYVPKGRYGVFGHIAIATAATSAVHYARVMQGTTEANPATQPRIMSGAAVVVGGGLATSPGVANVPFSIPFSSSDMLVDVPRDWAAEIWVEVYAENIGANASSALASSGQGINSTISKCTFIRWDGLHGTS